MKVHYMRIDAIMDKKEMKEFRDLEKQLSQKNIDRAEREATKKGATYLSKHIRDVKTLTQKDTKKYIVPKEGTIYVRSGKMTVGKTTHFRATPTQYVSQKGIPVKKRRKASVTITKDKKQQMRHLFVLNPDKVKNGPQIMLWERDERGVYRPFRTASIAETAAQEKYVEPTIQHMKEAYESRLEHYIKRSK